MTAIGGYRPVRVDGDRPARLRAIARFVPHRSHQRVRCAPQLRPPPRRGAWPVEIVLDPPGHVRLDRPDIEIIDRTVAIQGLAGRDVCLLTCDTSQHTRGWAAGLQVTKVATKDPGNEPDWAAPDRSGTGVRAQRRARQTGMDNLAEG